MDSAVNSAMGSDLNNAVGSAITQPVVETYGKTLKAVYNRYLGGQFWAGGWWYGLAWQTFMTDVCGLELNRDLQERLTAAVDVAMSACYWWPHKDFVVVSDRPSVINKDSKGRLHCDNGPSIAFRDGWALYHWHGTEVPRLVIESPELITVDMIESEKNAEIRRVLIERYGLSRFVTNSDYKVIHQDVDSLGLPRRLLCKPPRPGTADEPIMMLDLCNSTLEPDGTRKKYLLRVHPEIRPLKGSLLGLPQAPTCQNAVASTFGMTGTEYQLVGES